MLGSPDLFADTASTLGYVANWHFIAAHTDYFATVSNPSPLQHTWTLAIEEQFYLVWPLIVLAVVWVVRRRGPGGRRAAHRRAAGLAAGQVAGQVAGRDAGRDRRVLLSLAVIAAAGAVASALLMAALAPVGAASVGRAYYGSDTRAQGLLVGCALAALCLWRGPAPLRTARGRRVTGALGLAGAAGAVVMWRTVAESSAFTFHGAFLLIALCGAAVIACVTLIPDHPLAKALSLRPLPYLGRISYGMYLWYWPVLLVMTPERTHLYGVALLTARLLAIVAVAGLSYHLVEAPIQRGALSRWRALAAAPIAAAAVLLMPLLAPIGAAVLPSATASAASGGQSVVLPPPLAASATIRPVRILLVGDSMAGSLGVGLSQVAPLYGAQVVNEGMPGCSLATSGLVKVLIYTVPPGSPCRGGPGHLLGVYRDLVNEYNPDVVVYVARSDTLTTYLDGSWQHLGMPSFDRWTASRFAQAVPILSSRGAHVVFLTSPVYDSGEQADGTPWPENDPSRVSTDNSLMAEVARRYPNVTSVINLEQWVTPGGHYASAVDDVPVRCADGVHFTALGGRWVGVHILGQIVTSGQTHASTPTSLARAPLPPQAPPSWYAELPCGT